MKELICLEKAFEGDQQIFQLLTESLVSNKNLFDYEDSTIQTRIEDAIRADNGNALVLKAFMLLYSGNNEAGIKLLDEASALKNSNAMFVRAFTFRWGIHCQEDYPAAIDLLEGAIALMNSNAMYLRAMMYKEKKPVNFPAVIDLLQRAIDLRHSDAMYARAMMHLAGSGGPFNSLTANKLLDDAINLGNLNAMDARADNYWSDTGGGAQNPKAAAKLYRMSYSKGRRLKSRDKLLNLRGWNDFEVKYHVACGLLDESLLRELCNQDPVSFGNLVLADDLMTSELQTICQDIMSKQSDILFRQASRKDNGESWVQWGKRLVQLGHKALQNNRIKIAQKFNLLVIGGQCSSKDQGQAYFGLAMTALKQLDDLYPGLNELDKKFETMKPFLEGGIALKNEDCQQLYVRMFMALQPEGTFAEWRERALEGFKQQGISQSDINNLEEPDWEEIFVPEVSKYLDRKASTDSNERTSANCRSPEKTPIISSFFQKSIQMHDANKGPDSNNCSSKSKVEDLDNNNSSAQKDLDNNNYLLDDDVIKLYGNNML